MDVRLLGPVELRVGGHSVVLPGARGRAVLAVLALRAGTTVSRDTLIEAVWGEPAPPSATKLLQVQISHLRRLLADAGEPDRIATRPGGYELRLDGEELDVARAERLLAAGAPGRQARDALALWRGAPLEDLADAEFGRDERRRLADLRLEAIELAARETLDADPDATLRLLDRLSGEDPLRESAQALRMRALYRAGRHSVALDSYTAFRRRLVDDRGLEPGPELRALQTAILRHDPALLPAPAAVDVPAPPADAPRTRLLLAVAAVVVAALLVAGAWSATGGSRDTVLPPAIPAGDSVAAVDPVTGRVVAYVPVGTQPRAVAAGGGAVWVANAGDASLSRIDVHRRAVTRTFTPGGTPVAVAVTGGHPWTVDGARSALRQLDPAFATVRRIGLPHELNPFWLPAERVGLAAAGERAVVADGRAGLVEVDLRSGQRIRRLGLGFFASAVALRAGEVWAADPTGMQIVRVDRSGAVSHVPVAGEPVALLAPRAGGIWAADALGGTVVHVDPARPAVRATIAVGGHPEALTADGDGIWVATGAGRSLVRIDARTDRITRRVPLGRDVAGVAASGGLLWATLHHAPMPPRAAAGRVRIAVEQDPPSNDPALDLFPVGWRLAHAMCAFLLVHPDRPGRAGTRLVPDVAAALPRVSDGGRTYTFRIRRGMRFAPPSGEPVTASSMAHTFERALDPRLGSDAGSYLDELVGEPAFRAGRARHIRGLEVHGDRLVFRLSHPSPAFLSKVAMPYFCAVPAGTPPRRGLDGIPTAGPYAISAHDPDRLLVLRRNPYYGGTRPQRPAEIDLLFGIPRAQYASAVRRGTADDATDVPAGTAPADMRYTRPMLALRYLRLNAGRPLFASPRRRRAAGLAIDRSALAADPGVRPAMRPTDQFIPPAMPGFDDVHAAPLAGADVQGARRLIGPRRRTAILITGADPAFAGVASLLRRQLARIGIDVRVRRLGADPSTYVAHHPWDMAFLETWFDDYADPSEFTNALFDSAPAPQPGVRTPPGLTRQLRRAARTPLGPARWRAYAALDDRLSRHAVPFVPIGTPLDTDVLSPRLGCRIAQPVYGLDLAALCTRDP